MRDLYSDDYESVATDGADRLIPEGVRRLAGAAVFIGLVAAMGLWSYRLGTRDAGEVPIIRAMEGPARVEPEDPGGLQAPHQGLEVNAVLAGEAAPVPRELASATPTPPALTPEDTAQGELVLAAPAALAEQLLGGGSDDLAVPPPEEPAELAATDEEAAPVPSLGALVAEIVEPQAAAGPRPRNRPSNLVVARAKTEPVASPAAAKPAAAAAPDLRPGARLVQLGAFDSEEITRRAWDQLVARNGDLLGSKRLHVERTTANARVFYRLRVAGFASADETRAMCEALRSRGVDCIPVTLQ
jgi:hypothetical protein